LVAGGGFAHLRAHAVQVDVGVRRRAATLQNRAFFTVVREGRPFVILKAAVSADGYLAAAPGVRTPLSSEASLRHAHGVRAEVDAIGVGSGTLLVDDPLLTSRHVYRARPLARVVFDRRLRTRPGARVFSTIASGPVIICTSGAAMAAQPERVEALIAAGATLEPGEGFAEVLRRLARLGITSLLLEGGALLHQAAWDARLVDHLQIYRAPVCIGEGGVPFLPGRDLSLAALADGRTAACGPDVLIEGYVHRLD
jgi:diaminohydroxyphosphoribosylaminopyrimidine deaminase/5-amino-6-(5-phosphoribosylamino)uracil reductase